MSDKPKPTYLGTGYASFTARILELQARQREAALRMDFDAVDAIQREIQELNVKAAEAKQREAGR
jgi:hypothetical protein